MIERPSQKVGLYRFVKTRWTVLSRNRDHSDPCACHAPVQYRSVALYRSMPRGVVEVVLMVDIGFILSGDPAVSRTPS